MTTGWVALALYLVSFLDPRLRVAFKPLQRLVAWTEREGEVSIRWSTGLPVYQAKTWYRELACEGRNADLKWQEVTPTSTFFFKYKVVFWELLYTAILQNLDSTCQYEYKVGANFHVSPTARISGRTPYYESNPLKAAKPAKLVIYGDMGRGYYSLPTRRFLKKYLDENTDVAAILHLGDVAYNLDYMGGTVGDDFLRDIAGIADRIPYLIAPGNHEAAHNFTHLRTRFRMPQTPYNDNSGLFFSFNLGRGHFTIYSTEVYEYSSNQTQQLHRQWVERDLEAAEQRREETPWVFVLGHRPLYCNVDWTRSMESIKGFRSNNNCQVESPALRVEFEELFYRYGVDMVLAGHIHRYERHAAVYANTTVPSEVDTLNLHYNPKAAIHIISGIAGSDHEKNPLCRTPQRWNRIETNDYGFGVLTVLNSTHLYWEQWDAERERLADSLWVVKTQLRY